MTEEKNTDASERPLERVVSRFDSPQSFEELGLKANTASLLLRGLDETYLESLATDRVDVWARAAHSVINLIAQARPILRPRNG